MIDYDSWLESAPGGPYDDDYWEREEEDIDPCPSGWIDPKLKPNERDVTPNPQAFASPLAVLISARAVTVAKDWKGIP